jgi:predicted permease
VLLIGAGLLIRSSMLLQAVPVGFDSHNLLAMSIFLPHARYTDATVEGTFGQIDAAIAAIPGVRSVGRSQVAPIYGFGWSWGAFREGSNGHDEGAASSNMRFVSADYFTSLGVRLLRGRAFTRVDGAEAPPVAIVSRGLAKQLFGEVDPIGRRIADGGGKTPAWREIVGVVDDMHADGLAEEPPLELYMPSTQRTNHSQTILVRGAVPVTTLVPAIRRAVARVDPLLALSDVSTMEQALDKKLAMSRFTTWLLGLLGATGLVLAVVGVYGVIAYFVTQRTHEFGVRLALGASGAAVRWMVVRQGLALAAVGVVVGAILSLASTRLLATMMFGITPHDPVTFVSVALLLTIVAVFASFIPARRATRIDPLEALRSS